MYTLATSFYNMRLKETKMKTCTFAKFNRNFKSNSRVQLSTWELELQNGLMCSNFSLSRSTYNRLAYRE